jgi:hypothetical protein
MPIEMGSLPTWGTRVGACAHKLVGCSARQRSMASGCVMTNRLQGSAILPSGKAIRSTGRTCDGATLRLLLAPDKRPLLPGRLVSTATTSIHLRGGRRSQLGCAVTNKQRPGCV